VLIFFSISLHITEEVYEDDLYGLLIGRTLKPNEAWKKQEGGADDKSERIERLFAPNIISIDRTQVSYLSDDTTIDNRLGRSLLPFHLA
jgi:hypothetical protein